MRTTPHNALGVGSLTTIHRASKCLPQVLWYLKCIQKTNLHAWTRKKPIDCNSSGGYTTRYLRQNVRRALRTTIQTLSHVHSRNSTPKTLTSWRAHKTYTPFSYARPGSHPPCNGGDLIITIAGLRYKLRWYGGQTQLRYHDTPLSWKPKYREVK